MTIILNGEPREVAAGVTLATVIADLQLKQRRYAVEVNHSVVRRDDYPSCALCEGDQVEVITFVGGG